MEKVADEKQLISRERFYTIVTATRTLIAMSRYCMGLVVSDDPVHLMRVQDARDRIDEASDAIHEEGPWPSLDQLFCDLENKIIIRNRRITDLEAQLAEKAKDTERLDWLETSDHDAIPMSDGWDICPMDGVTVSRGTLREAIDAARSGEG